MHFCMQMTEFPESEGGLPQLKPSLSSDRYTTRFPREPRLRPKTKSTSDMCEVMCPFDCNDPDCLDTKQ